MRPTCPPISQLWHVRSKSLDQGQNATPSRSRVSENQKKAHDGQQPHSSKGSRLVSPHYPVFFAPLSRMIYKQKSPRGQTGQIEQGNEQQLNFQDEYLENMQFNINNIEQLNKGGRNMLQMSKQKQATLRQRYMPKRNHYLPQQQGKNELIPQLEGQEIIAKTKNEQKQDDSKEKDNSFKKDDNININFNVDHNQRSLSLKSQEKKSRSSNQQYLLSLQTINSSNDILIQNQDGQCNEVIQLQNSNLRSNELDINDATNKIQGIKQFSTSSETPKILNNPNNQLKYMDILLNNQDNQESKFCQFFKPLPENDESNKLENISSVKVENSSFGVKSNTTQDSLQNKIQKQKQKIREPVGKATPILSPSKLVGVNKIPSKSVLNFYNGKQQVNPKAQLSIVDLFRSTNEYFQKSKGESSPNNDLNIHKKLSEIQLSDSQALFHSSNKLQQQFQQLPESAINPLMQGKQQQVHQNPPTQQLSVFQLSYLNLDENIFLNTASGQQSQQQIEINREKCMQHSRKISNQATFSNTKQGGRFPPKKNQSRDYQEQKNTHGESIEIISNYRNLEDNGSQIISMARKQDQDIKSNQKLLNLFSESVQSNQPNANFSSETPIRMIENLSQFNRIKNIISSPKSSLNYQGQEQGNQPTTIVKAQGKSFSQEIKGSKSNKNVISPSHTNGNEEQQIIGNFSGYFNRHYNINPASIVTKQSPYQSRHSKSSHQQFNKSNREAGRSIQNGSSCLQQTRDNFRLSCGNENHLTAQSIGICCKTEKEFEMLENQNVMVSGFDSSQEIDQEYGIDNYVLDDRHKL